MGQCISQITQCASNAKRPPRECYEPYISARRLPQHTHSILKDYIITDQVVGTGSSGPIRLLQRRGGAVKFALKVLLDCPMARRQVEIQFLACQHPNVVPIIDVYENLFRECRCLFMVFENMAGGHLLEVMKAKHTVVTERNVVRVVRDLGSAIAYMHAKGIAHRDVKLENIFYSRNGVLKLGDFSYATKENDSELSTLNRNVSSIEGWERLRYDQSRDMWSIGIIMYFLLCGYPPYCFIQESDFSKETLQKIDNGDFLFPVDQWQIVSPMAKRVLKKLLRMDFEDRMTADELMVDPWIVECSRATDTPLCTTALIHDREFMHLQDQMFEQMTGIRAINKQIQVKPLNSAINSLLMIRLKVEEEDMESSSETVISTPPPCPTPVTSPA